MVGDAPGPVADLGPERVKESAHLSPRVGLHALAVAGSRTWLPAAVRPADLEPRASGKRRGDSLASGHLGPLGRELLELLGNVDHRPGVVAVEELVPEEMATRPAGVAVGAKDLGVADRDHGALSDRHVVDAHVDPALVPACWLE